MQDLTIHNRQRTRGIQIARFRMALHHLLECHLQLKSWEIGIQLVGPARMSRINQQFLDHEGSTDVITFDHQEVPQDFPSKDLHGELFICIQDAIVQAVEFDTHWTLELMRYAIHGILHLQGFDDLEPDVRTRMKARENQLVRKLSAEFPIRGFEKPVGKRTVSGLIQR